MWWPHPLPIFIQFLNVKKFYGNISWDLFYCSSKSIFNHENIYCGETRRCPDFGGHTISIDRGGWLFCKVRGGGGGGGGGRSQCSITANIANGKGLPLAALTV